MVEKDTTAQTLTAGMEGEQKAQIIAALTQMPKERLTSEFISTAQTLMKGTPCDFSGQPHRQPWGEHPYYITSSC